MIRKMCAAILLLVAFSTVATSLSAQFNLTNIMSYQFNGAGRGPAHYVEADFGATAHTEAWTFTITTDIDAPVTLVIMEVPTMSTATTAAGFNGGFLAGTYTPTVPTGGSSTLGHTTPSLSGIHRFVVWLQLTAGTVPFPANVSVDVNNGANTATATTGGGTAWDVYNGGLTGLGASGTTTADVLYQPNNMRCWTQLASATDSIAFDAIVDHGSTSVAIDLGLYATLSGGTGSGNVVASLYDMTGDGGQTPVVTHTLTGLASAGAEDAGTFQTPARTGTHRYRVVVTGGTGFAATPDVYTHLAWGSNPPFSAFQTPVDYSTPVSISPGGSAITATTALTASGGSGTPSYIWSLIGTPPTGVALSGTAGTSVDLQLTGSPAGSVTVRAANGTTGEFAEETYTLSGTGGAGTITIATTTLANGIEAIAYSETLTATTTGTTGPTYTWSSTGILPPPLALGGATGLSETLAGTPSAAGTYNFSITVTDGTVSDTKAYSITIATAGSIIITTTSLANGTVNSAYSANIVSIGGTGTLTWSVSAGTLPAGMALGNSSSNTEVLSGIPTLANTYNFTLQVTDGTNTDTQAFTVVIGTGTPLIGSGGGGGGGCAASTTGMTWLALLGLLAVAFVGLRSRREE